MVNYGRIGLGSLVVLALTACGGGGSSEDSAATITASPAKASTSTFANKTYFALDPKETDLYYVSTLKFGDVNSKAQGGQGYLDGDDYISSYLDTDWSMDGETLILKDLSWQLSVVKQDGDTIELCGSNYPGTKLTSCADNVREVWYTDKAKAKAFVTSKTQGTTKIPDLSVSTVPDEKLRALLTNMELDYTQQLTRLYVPGQGIENLTGLGQFTDIERLRLTENKVTDISALSSLTKLKKLYIEDQKNSDETKSVSITDFAPLAQLSALTHLWMGSYDAPAPAKKFDLSSFLSQLTTKAQMVELRMSNVGLITSDVGLISGMPNLESLRIEESPSVTDLSGLYSNDWSKLKRLEVGYNGDGDTNVTFDLDSMISKGLTLSKLTNLKIADTTTTDANLTTIGQGVGSNLINLDLRSISNTGYDMGSSFSVPNLQQFRLSRSGEVYDFAALSNVLTPSTLTLLYLEKGTINDFAANASRYTRLATFRPRKSNVSGMTAQSFTDALKSMTKLTSLDIRETTVGGTAITCSQLVGLGLSASVSCSGT